MTDLTDYEFDVVYKFIHDEIDDFTNTDWAILENLSDDNVDYIVEMKQASWYENPC
ncbi:hypothetical protein RA178_06180 [Shewanella oncorhynchi]|uniref:Uncharacterized protein n=1 Tax=Shewanella oncorhynchi TaxID=2726434 RepID=A0AA50Q498_9GAMM|nr:hypothetical protein [Shewanella oncorhynchi]WMB74199.1 hypothetical protein RA178_06180 [Shewanella oncorhynchi]